MTPTAIRAALIGRDEIALLDVREEGSYAEAHPLFAVSLPIGRIEADVFDRVPRLTTPIVVYDAGEGLVDDAVATLRALGYTSVAQLAGGLDGWAKDGGELFRDVNSASKAFGELVEAHRHTPSIPATELKALLDAGADVVVLDARREDEFQTMSIPGGISAPGAELVWRAGAAAPRADTLVVVNCAGRTRSIIGTQSLVNAGIPNQVAALRNGTIGWTLDGLALAHGQTGRAPAPAEAARSAIAASARAVANRAGVRRVSADGLRAYADDARRTLYRFDVRDPPEFDALHPIGFRSAPGGQLVQETDVFAPVRGARIVLWDPAGVRADMTASWLAQMNWEVYVLDADPSALPHETGAWRALRPPFPAVTWIESQALAGAIAQDVLVLDVAPSPQYLRGHVPGAWFVSPPRLREAAQAWRHADRVVVTSSDGVAAAFVAPRVAALVQAPVMVLEGGTSAWHTAGLPLRSGPERLSTPVTDVYKRPYEGTDNARTAMQAYLEWEYGLVAQLGRDGTHGFTVI
ncbi:MAG TPA: rhodanese-like domain-containing protein [Vicinamibacterales bacterium]